MKKKENKKHKDRKSLIPSYIFVMLLLLRENT